MYLSGAAHIGQAVAGLWPELAGGGGLSAVAGSGLLAALPDWRVLVQSPTTWGLVCGAVALVLMLPRGSAVARVLGGVVGLVALGLLAAGQPLLSDWLAQGLFWILAGVTVLSAAAAVAMRSAVYAAVWFAMSLLGTGSLFLLQGASFLGVATVVVYAGAIVVTFLFVIMLAQPEGHATYDRLTWGWYAKPVSVLAAALMVAVLTTALPGIRQIDALAALGESGAVERSAGVLHPSHMARFGAELFSRELVSVEVAGTLLLVALVGAIAIMIQGRRQAQAEESAR
ncbi:MAG: NADH-quinone oxidoreductase subunit J [Pirellulaceae bacterium]|nr:NADH-quinone oxidoreductase subunit J [Pirellulaceae bacterium]